jgi:hypothetical protein
MRDFLEVLLQGVFEVIEPQGNFTEDLYDLDSLAEDGYYEASSYLGGFDPGDA